MKSKTHMVVLTVMSGVIVVRNTSLNKKLYDTVYFAGSKAECKEWVKNFGDNV